MACPDLQPTMIRICTTILLFCKLYMAQTGMLQQTGRVTRAHLGESVTLECYFSQEQKEKRFYWFKQTSGNKPSVVVRSQAHTETVFSEDFNPARFKPDKGKAHFHLTIANISHSDEGMYLCGMKVSYEVMFGNGTFLAVEGDQGCAATTVVQAPLPAPVYPGGSVTLQCTVLTEKPAEDFRGRQEFRGCQEVRVLWIRRSSGDSHPGLIYSPTNSSSECEEHCVHSLSMNNLGPADSGIYYCVVDICGQVRFGNGTVLEMRSSALLNTVVISLGGVLVACICIVGIWLSCSGRECDRSTESPTDHFETQEDVADTTQVSYAAVEFSERKPKASKKKERATDTWRCVS